VLTMGKGGALLALASGERFNTPPHDVAVADVTGAGDAFWAGLLLALLDGLPPRRAADVGQFVAERKLEVFGPMQARLDRKEIYQTLWEDDADATPRL
ncbi:MAG TPA: hypothetical protein EYP77_07725, partial [Anaerolineae bacterium]|nr:hypothetical protein [Anaerolineae bacterium]